MESRILVLRHLQALSENLLENLKVSTMTAEEALEGVSIVDQSKDSLVTRAYVEEMTNMVRFLDRLDSIDANRIDVQMDILDSI